MKFRMTDVQLEKIITACKPVKYMVIGGTIPRSPQENANYAWGELGKKIGFDAQSVRPFGHDPHEFSADPINLCDRCARNYPECNTNITFGIDMDPSATGREADCVMSCDGYDDTD